jgi:hypothetical protein
MSRAIQIISAFLLLVGSTPVSAEESKLTNFEKIITGEERPLQIPENWLGRPTESAPGWRWDDPNDAGNSVRIFAGDPTTQSPSEREPYVVVVSGGKTIGRDGTHIHVNVIAPE